ncbi:hypothetical protein NITHO_4000009 [Nitrolancea hollandica Lb]|uniref:Uncharacterized protein n=1 Tax=Nitrolancea hollandica Lb TaxID=1129897 RepID=I4EJG5_9BACT|nr:hypothetical protein NITHO_4000009 [Nitrolancea hollandica Lb]
MAGMDLSRLSSGGRALQAAPLPDLLVGVPLAAPRCLLRRVKNLAWIPTAGERCDADGAGAG